MLDELNNQQSSNQWPIKEDKEWQKQNKTNKNPTTTKPGAKSSTKDYSSD